MEELNTDPNYGTSKDIHSKMEMEIKTESKENSIQDQLLEQSAIINGDNNESDSDVEQEIQFLQILNSKFPIVLMEKLEICNEKIRGGKNEKKFVKKKKKKKINGAFSVSSDRRKSIRLKKQENDEEQFESNIGKTINESHGKRKLNNTFINYKTYKKSSDTITNSETIISKMGEVKSISPIYETSKETHLKKHEENYTVLYSKCSMCDYVTNQNEKLKVHMMIHEPEEHPPKPSHQSSGTKQFQCSDCDFKTKYKPNLKVHLARSHAGTKRFCCSVCGYGSYFKNRLKAHMQVHSDYEEPSMNQSPEVTHNFGDSNSDDCSENNFENNFDCKEKRCSVTYHDSSMKGNSYSDLEASSSAENSNEVHLISLRSQEALGCFFEGTNYEFESNKGAEIKKQSNCHSIVNCKTNLPTQIWVNEIGSSSNACPSNSSTFINSKGRTHNSLKRTKYKCPICNFKTQRKGIFKKHELTHPLLKCSSCDFDTRVKSTFIHHLKSHSNNKFRCSECEFETFSDQLFACHLDKHFPKEEKASSQLYHCDECSFTTNIKGNLKRHSLCHSNSKLFKCIYCQFKTNYNFVLKRHITWCFGKRGTSKKNVVEDYSSSSNMLKCEDCSFESFSRNKMKSHLVAKHSKSAPSEFKSCHKSRVKEPFATHSNKELDVEESESMELDDSTTLFNSSNGWFRCMKCSFKSQFKGNLRRHFRNHADSKMYKCSKCNFGTNYKYLFERHQLSKHSQGSLFECLECEFVTRSVSTFETHVLTHEKGLKTDENIALGSHENTEQEQIRGIISQQSDERKVEGSLLNNSECNTLKSINQAHKIIPLESIKHEIEKFEIESIHEDFVLENITPIENVFENINDSCAALENDVHYQDLTTLDIDDDKDGLVAPENTGNYQELTVLENVGQKTNVFGFESKIREQNRIRTHKNEEIEYLTTHFDELINEYSCSHCFFKTGNSDSIKTHLLTHVELKFTEVDVQNLDPLGTYEHPNIKSGFSFRELPAHETSELRDNEIALETKNRSLFQDNSEQVYELSFSKF